MSTPAVVEATVEEGKIVLPAEANWPTGAKVRVQLIEENQPTLYDVLKEFDGMATDLPPDYSRNFGKYLHELRKPKQAP